MSNDLDQSIRFYSNLFGMEPSVRKDDYAKWMLDDPRVNFAISHRGNAIGVNHLGLQVESDAELASVRGQFAAADAAATVDEPGANCCYAKSDKHWVTDPQGIAWEAFHTLGTIPLFGGDSAQSDAVEFVLFAGDGATGRRERLLRPGNRAIGRGMLRTGGARRLIAQNTCPVVAVPAQCPPRSRKSARNASR